jgi:hypothetical protein
MSEKLPEASAVAPLPTKPIQVPSKGSPETIVLSAEEQQGVSRMFGNPAYFPEAFKSWIVQYMALNGEPIPQSQVQGLAPLSVSGEKIPATGDASETTTSTTYTDLSTVGPSLQVGAGKYALIFGCHCFSSTSSHGAGMSLSVAGATAVDADSVSMSGTGGISITRVLMTDLSGPSNAIVAKYRAVTGSTATFYRRFLVAIRYGNA